ncbi:MAG: response regulator transcription factor [Kofleriaceae bacterium]|nr:response regulator transcription factor [Kofleriaceae bacterium]MBP9165837.1 response regulator transcription factor [Kofleriaceae bacterium]MBP9861724.1 response regulator transcription factor [Kofleriaceae bacterium]
MKDGRDILVVEDDEAIATGLSLNLRLAGHRATVAADGEAALTEVAARAFDLILLDINLPRKNGLDVLAALRSADNFVPVIVLSARDGEYDKVAALRLGADDYVTKPFALAELLARVDAVLRRAAVPAPQPVAAPSAATVRFADVVLDPVQHTVTRGGEPVKLTHLEYELLLFFVRHPAQAMTRQHLLEMVWGQSAGTPRTIDNFVGQLRKRLELDPEHPRHFVTIRGSGYRFDP